MKMWKYRNDTTRAVIWRDRKWGPGEEKSLHYPVPEYLELTCVQEGSEPDPVLCHEDIVLKQGESRRIEIAAPLSGNKVALSLACIGDGGAECRFNSEDNTPIPVDGRSFNHVLPWEFCSIVFLKNIAEGDTQVSVSAVEAAM